MIGLIILTVIVVYIVVSSSIVKYICRKTENQKIRLLAVAIEILFPFWDMIIHYPVYWLLANMVPTVERYKPYEKVDGFYEKFIPNGNIVFNMFLHDTFNKKYSLYYANNNNFNKKHHRWETKYYKAFWLNDSTSPACFPPKPSTVMDKYIELINKNWCVAVEEINESQMTKYWKLNEKIVFHVPIFYFNIYIVDFFVSDRHTDEPFFRLRDIFVDKSWMTAINVVSGRKTVRSGTGFTYVSDGDKFNFPDYNIIKILDSKELPILTSHRQK
jgi:hypothetical protein